MLFGGWDAWTAIQHSCSKKGRGTGSAIVTRSVYINNICDGASCLVPIAVIDPALSSAQGSPNGVAKHNVRKVMTLTLLIRSFIADALLEILLTICQKNMRYY